MGALIASRNLTCLSDSIDNYPEGIIIPIDKPYRWTSADVIRKIKWAACRHFGKKVKVGHAGTLDPLATGVLLVCIGKATKLAEDFQKHDKEYVAGISFGATTASYDLEKEIDRMFPTDGVSEESLRGIIPSFIGEQEQIAPLFSAKSVDGVRAYDIARRKYQEALQSGEEFDHTEADTLSRQMICIREMELLGFWPEGKEELREEPAEQDGRNLRFNVTDNSALHLPHAEIRVACSKGTYIRALARDLGEALGSGAHLDSLRRTRTGGFRVEDAISPEKAVDILMAGVKENAEQQKDKYMETRFYKVAGIPFGITIEQPWRFMEYTPAVAERIRRAAQGEEIDTVPCRAGDEVPARTFVRSKEELPEGRTRCDINLSQYEPFRTEECETAFSLKVCRREPSWIQADKQSGKCRLILSVDDTQPRYFIYRDEDKTVFEFEAEEGNVVGTLCISADASTGDFYPKEGKSARAILYQISTAAMVMFTHHAALRRTLLMHASTVRHNGRANMFLGTSGTGKSTHSRLWLSNIEGCDLVNDDNPAIQVSEDGKEAFVYGTPWSGKTPCYRNICVPLRAIVRLTQAPHNKISEIKGIAAYACIISSASSIRWERNVMDGISKTAEAIVGCVKCCSLECLPDADAAFTCMNFAEEN